MTSNEKKENEDARLSVPENDGPRAQMYIAHVLWMATYVKNRAHLGGITEEQIIGQFELNVRRVMDPQWKSH